MNDIALEFNHVWKKFKKGEKYDSLRDLIPAMTKRLFTKNNRGELQEKEFWAVKDVSFEVKRGEALGIIGPNGAGKSTILKLLSGILKPNKGHIKVNGRLSALIEVGAGFHPDLTGRENVYLNGAILGMKKGVIDKKFDEIVEFSGISEFIDTPVKRYSSGMFARLGFSVAAHVDPDILLVDEVLSVGDLAFQKKCLDKMNAIVQSGATIIMVSHNLKSVATLCDRSLLLNQGRLLMSDDTGKVVAEYMKENIAKTGSSGRSVFISDVTLMNSDGGRAQFRSGEKAVLEIAVSATEGLDRLSLAIYVMDESFYRIFNTSSSRLGYETFALDRGQTRKFRFELDMHLTRGQFFLGVILKDYTRDILYDEVFPAVGFVVTSDQDVRGGANLYPKFFALENALADRAQGCQL